MTKEQQIQNYIEEMKELLGEEITYEQAEKELLSSGTISNSERNSNWAFAFKQIPELKACSLFGTSRFASYNFTVKKDKTAQRFEEGEFYLGASVIKNKDQSVDLPRSTLGKALGDSINIIVLGALYYGKRNLAKETRDAAKKRGEILPNDINTTFSDNIFEDGQRRMLDRDTGFDLWTLRKTLEKEYGGKELIPDLVKIKFHQYIYGLAETPEGWEPFWTTVSYNGSDDSITSIIAKTKQAGELRSKIISWASKNEGGKWIKRAEVIGTVPTALHKVSFKEFVSLSREMVEIQQSQLASVKHSIKSDKALSNPKPALNVDEDENLFDDIPF